MAQLASVLAWGASGRPFESDHPDKKCLQFVSIFLFLSSTEKHKAFEEPLLKPQSTRIHYQ